MNLHQLVRNSIGSINPEKKVTIKRFVKDKIDESGLVKNDYETYNPDLGFAIEIFTKAQVQPLSSEDLEHVFNYNASNSYRKMFINGKEEGLSTALKTNGDLVIMDGQTWIINEVIGLWDESGWNEVILCRQNEFSVSEDELKKTIDEIPLIWG